MRCLKKNQRRFFYYLYKDKVPVTDSDGNQTGEYSLTYQRPVECFGNISAGSGDSQTELFGTNVIYERVIVIDNPNCPIDTTSLLCIDVLPKPFSARETPVHDYIVKAMARSLNSISIAISKVKSYENND